MRLVFKSAAGSEVSSMGVGQAQDYDISTFFPNKLINIPHKEQFVQIDFLSFPPSSSLP